uniref:Inactive homolog of metal-dependent proteases, putative molecular chaperone n=1 Tax=uncultured Fidelibacterota bacterium HF0010_18O13 TaxID=710789 RepID=E0XR92_9BACT|nr:inactive homolog of metal-dependent proteases, putative molecular chaperone [uncultured Marinimicrobia bacterium HF0010_18O13]
MNLLGIESSSRKLSVGLMKEESFSELHSEKINDTANSLPQLSKKIINNASLSFEDLDTICISAGPGSFTGLRVGMSYAKGIAMALDIPIVPVSTFDSLAYNNASKELSTLIYSHGNTFYICEYSLNNGILLKSSEPKSILKEDVLELSNNIVLNGPMNIFEDLKAHNLKIEFKELSVNNIVKIAHQNFKLLKTKSLDNLVPEYVGNFEVK